MYKNIIVKTRQTCLCKRETKRKFANRRSVLVLCTFSRWGGAAVCSSAVVFVSLGAACTAPAAPAPPAGPHTTRWAARVRARLAHATCTPLCCTLSASASRTHTCQKSRKVVIKMKSSFSHPRSVLRCQWWLETAVNGHSPFCLMRLSAVCPGLRASDLKP